ncbi:hypothetical protein Gotri_010997 [Gossypium trilobum]|uniref:Uncharacterized protein n=1 Tax=Gossypium trilobum TaxID=34281 RepID=A0A7J9ESA4_9ROSI|nr:hypothetical protein [Gossypium trilobum]
MEIMVSLHMMLMRVNFLVQLLVLCTGDVMELGGLLPGATHYLERARCLLISSNNLFTGGKSKPILIKEENKNLKFQSLGTLHQLKLIPSQ